MNTGSRDTRHAGQQSVSQRQQQCSCHYESDERVMRMLVVAAAHSQTLQRDERHDSSTVHHITRIQSLHTL